VAIEEAGEVDTAEKEADEEDMVEGLTEIVVAGAVSDSSERSLNRRLTYDLDLAYRGRGDGEFRGRGDGMKRNASASPLILIVDCVRQATVVGGMANGEVAATVRESESRSIWERLI